MSDTVIKVEGLHKKFCQSLKRSLFYGTMDATKSMFGFPIENVDLRKKEFWALQNINFELKRGETLGLIGQNGSGKTTLLRLINGIFPPDKGKITINGRIGALIAVGAGFHPHMTGRENIYLNGTILGMTKVELKRKFDEIVDFAQIGEFIDSPVATYSSGMTVRLGFAIAIHCEPEIVLLDEILAVGDAKFQRKCLNKIKDLRENKDVSFILVSHNMQNIEAMCSKILFVDKGKQILAGIAQEVIPFYELFLNSGKSIAENYFDSQILKTNSELPLLFKYSDFGTDEIKVDSVKIQNVNDSFSKIISSDYPFAVSIEVNVKKNLDNIYVWLALIYVNDKNDNDKNFSSLGIREKFSINKGKYILNFDFENIHLATGEYKIGFFIFDETFTNPYTQGYYGYFSIAHPIPTMLKVGYGTPLCWLNSKIEIINN